MKNSRSIVLTITITIGIRRSNAYTMVTRDKLWTTEGMSIGENKTKRISTQAQVSRLKRGNETLFWLRNHAAYMAERNWGRINSTSCKYLCIVLIVLIREHVLWQVLKPLALIGDQERISPYNINTISTRQLLRIKENINLRIIRWSITKFSKLT